MTQHKVIADDSLSAMDEISRVLGKEAVILNTQKVNGKIEILGSNNIEDIASSNAKKINKQKNDFSHLFSANGVIKQILKTEILNNKNIDFKLDISANKIKNFDNFVNIFLKSKIQEGLIDLDETKFSWKNYVNFNLIDSLIYTKDGKLILDANSEIDIINSDEVYKFLLTPKNLRKKINKMNLNFTYLFDDKVINITDIKVDGILNESLNNNFNQILLKDNNLQNKIYFKKLLNDAIRSYAG